MTYVNNQPKRKETLYSNRPVIDTNPVIRARLPALVNSTEFLTARGGAWYSDPTFSQLDQQPPALGREV